MVVDTCAEETRDVGEIAEAAPLDLAWKVGFVRARNDAKMLAKKGLFVGMITAGG